MKVNLKELAEVLERFPNHDETGNWKGDSRNNYEIEFGTKIIEDKNYPCLTIYHKPSQIGVYSCILGVNYGK